MRTPSVLLGLAFALAASSGCAATLHPRASVTPVDVIESEDSLADAQLEALALEMAIDSARATFAAMMKVFFGPSAAPLLQLGAPALPFGGAQSAVVNPAPRIALPAPAGGAPPNVRQPIPVPRTARARPAICHNQPVLRGR